MRSALLLLAALALSACFDSTTVLTDPRSGRTRRCESELLGLNPWSQAEAGTARNVAAGWVPRGYGR